MSNISIFNFQETFNVRVVIDSNGEPWFAAHDISNILEYRNASDLVRILDEDEKGTHEMRTPGGTQKLSTINESGLYHAVFKSKKKEALKFRKWITQDVLPSIRKTGSYSLPKIQEQTPPARQASILEVRQLSTAIGNMARYFCNMGSQTIYSNVYIYLKKEFQVDDLMNLNIDQLKISLDKIKQIESVGHKLYMEYTIKQGNLFFSFVNQKRVKQLELLK